MIDKQLLLQGCKQFEIELSTQAAEQLDTYAQLLVEWNGKMNLTAITDPQGIVFKHFVDSLLLLKAVEQSSPAWMESLRLRPHRSGCSPVAAPPP